MDHWLRRPGRAAFGGPPRAADQVAGPERAAGSAGGGP